MGVAYPGISSATAEMQSIAGSSDRELVMHCKAGQDLFSSSDGALYQNALSNDWTIWKPSLDLHAWAKTSLVPEVLFNL